MSDAAQSFIHEITEQVRPLHIAFTRAMWEAATNATPQASQREKETKAALMHFWADKERFETASHLDQTRSQWDPLTARTIQRIYLAAAKAQQDEATIEEVTRLETEAQRRFYNFRAIVYGQPISDNDLDNILRTSPDSALVQEGWQASKIIGEEVAELIRELARLRNAAARAQGFRDHFQRSLTLNEIDEDRLLSLFSHLDEATRVPYQTLKAQIDRERAAHFNIPEADLQPWHFGDRFFQEAPEKAELPMDDFFAKHDPVELVTTTYDGLGMDIAAILERSDLYPRQGKDQHAFCVDIDRAGDIRTLNNLEPSYRWTATLLHEMGHAVYDQYIDHSLPWMLRTPPHALTTEAVAILMESLTYNKTWLTTVLGVKGPQAESLSQAAIERQRAQYLIFTRWALVMTEFERALYGDPEGDLDSLWWDLVERYQELRRPQNRRSPDWAAKYHIALVPVYYHSYELGYLVSAQVQSSIRKNFGKLVASREAGRWLKEHFFKTGASLAWEQHLESITGETLQAQYFVSALAPELSAE